MSALQLDRIPHHVAVIMDGNGRWAEARGMSRSEGHRAGVDAVRKVVRAADALGIEWLTLYAFSSENWNRPKDEVATLMQLPEEYFEEELPEAIERGTRILSIGNHDRLPPGTRRTLEKAIERTQDGPKMRLVFALSYGGRGEIVEAARRLLRDHEQGRIDPESLDEKTFAAYLDEPDMPDVDLLIRTGGESRISNFLLWKAAYAEILISDRLWPDFERKDLEQAICDYQKRERRYGLTSAQVRSGSK
ncbi:MAG: isoprenyl transferase [Myxococcota bacterium]|nr:isoprenyl transferase [Myxococcota bacterium]